MGGVGLRVRLEGRLEARLVVAMVSRSTYRRRVDSLTAVTAEVVACRACPRLVTWREQVGREKRAAFANEDYWARPVPGFGSAAASVMVVGLAPAAHGGNRTGRVFTGDRSGDWLFRSMWRAATRIPTPCWMSKTFLSVLPSGAFSDFFAFPCKS